MRVNFKTLIYGLLFIGVSFFYCVFCDTCDYGPAIIDYNTFGCKRAKNATFDQSKYDNNRTIEWILTDNNTGSFYLTFPLKSTFSSYSITLRVIEDGSNCMSENHPIMTEHTFLTYMLDPNSLFSECTEKASVRIQFVYTGYYELEIFPIGDNYDDNFEDEKILRCLELFTNYTKYSLQLMKPRIHFSLINERFHVTYAWPKEIWLTATLLSFELIKNSQLITSTWHWQTFLCPNKTVICKRQEEEMFQLEKCEITFDNNLRCTFNKLPAINYTLRLKVEQNNDARCNTNNRVWFQQDKSFRCIWKTEYELKAMKATGIIPVLNTHLDTKLIYIVSSVMILLVIISVLSGVCYMRCNKHHKHETSDRDLAIEVVTGDSTSILLIYARDCEPFMKLMQSFRLQLQNFTLNQVHDCFDPDQWEAVSQNPVEWIRRLILQKEMRIIVVSSKCASLLEQAHLGNILAQYKVPSSNDTLFLTALQHICDPTNLDNYRKMFVVRFDGFSDDHDLFLHLNKYTRFVLPMNLDSLIDSLGLPSCIKSGQSKELSKIKLRSLIDDLTEVVRYTNQNPHYLQTLLILYKGKRGKMSEINGNTK